MRRRLRARRRWVPTLRGCVVADFDIDRRQNATFDVNRNSVLPFISQRARRLIAAFIEADEHEAFHACMRSH